MAAVVSFWQVPEDEKDLLEFIQGTGRVVALPDHWVGQKWN